MEADVAKDPRELLLLLREGDLEGARVRVGEVCAAAEALFGVPLSLA